MQRLYEWLGIPFGFVISIFYALTGNYLLSLLCMTIIIRLCLLPASIKQQKGMAKQARLQPKLRRIQKKYEGNQRKIQEETQALYQREGTSGMTAGCFPMLLQLIIMMGLFQVNYHPFSMVLRLPDAVVTALENAVQPMLEGSAASASYRMELYALEHFHELDLSSIQGLTADMIASVDQFIERYTLFGLDLSHTPSISNPDIYWVIPIVSGLLALGMSLYSFLRQKKTNPGMANNASMGCMMFFTPVMQVWFAFILPINVGVYTIFSSILSFIQMVALNHIYSPKKVLARLMVEETIYRRSKEANTKRILEIRSQDD